MLPIAGTVRNAVQLSVLDNKWKQKKETLSKKERNQELTAEERQLKQYKEDMDRIQESNKYANISGKLKAGSALTEEEIKYLRQNNPDALKEYEEIKQVKETYKKQLKNCKSKEDVEKLKMTKLGTFMAEAKDISSNSRIPKGKKLELMEKLLKLVAGVDKEHADFTKSLQYNQLPEKEKSKEMDSDFLEMKETDETEESVIDLVDETTKESVVEMADKDIFDADTTKREIQKLMSGISDDLVVDTYV